MLDSLASEIAFRLQRATIARTFKKRHGYACNFENPKTSQEKLQFRKLYGNHEFYARVSDKYSVRSYVAERAGENYLIPLLGVYSRLDETLFETLPDEFIIKATHGCKWNKVVTDKKQLDVASTVRHFNKLLRRRYGWVAGERYYDFVEPRIVIEQLLHSEHGGLPWDYNFFCFSGPEGFDYSLGICPPGGSGATFDKDWNLLDSASVPDDELIPYLKPATFDEMLHVARRLSAGFDFVRVDLFSVAGRVYFGELTCTPGSGYNRIRNPKRQAMRDEMWRLDADNPLLYCKPETRQVYPGEWRYLLKGLRSYLH